MKLYHGSNQPIYNIDLSKGRKYKDFGQGFYTTHLREQAVYWSNRIADRFGGAPTVTEYEFDLDAVAAGLIYKELNSQYFFATERALKHLVRI